MAEPRPTEPQILAVRSTASGVEIDLAAPSTLLYFDGHFPGFAILPGIVQVDWAVRLARRYLTIGQRRPMAMQVKFRAPVTPDHRMTLALSLASEAKGERLVFEYRAGEIVHASGRIDLGPS